MGLEKGGKMRKNKKTTEGPNYIQRERDGVVIHSTKPTLMQRTVQARKENGEANH